MRAVCSIRRDWRHTCQFVSAFGVVRALSLLRHPLSSHSVGVGREAELITTYEYIRTVQYVRYLSGSVLL